jgi:hypothetical protein
MQRLSGLNKVVVHASAFKVSYLLKGSECGESILNHYYIIIKLHLLQWVFFGWSGSWMEAQNIKSQKMTVLCPLIIIILISWVIYDIIIKLLIMENRPSQNQKQNSLLQCLWSILIPIFKFQTLSIFRSDFKDALAMQCIASYMVPMP